MIQSIIVYTGLLAIMLIFTSFTTDKYKRIIGENGKEKNFFSINIILSILLFAIVFGMRYDVGTDYFAYLRDFLYKSETSRFEFIFQWIGKTIRSFGLGSPYYFGTLAFIQIFFFYFAFKKQKYLLPLLIFFLFTNGDVFSWMNIIRQAIAMCIWLYSLRYIEERKIWKYTFWIIIACGFHKSAILLLIFYPILKKESDYFKSISLQLLLLGFAFILRYYFSSVVLKLDSVVEVYSTIIGGGFNERYNTVRLAEDISEDKGTGLALLFKLILNIIIILYSKKLKVFYNNDRFNVMYFFFIFGLITMYVFPPGVIAISRPFRYFYIFQMIIYAHFAYFLKNSNHIKTGVFAYITLILLFIAVFYLSIITAGPDAHKWFQFYFQVMGR